MKPGYELYIEISFCWKCEQCDKRQEPLEDEEWPICCDRAMKYQPMRQFKVGPVTPPKEIS